jgi:hypothetical protein
MERGTNRQNTFLGDMYSGMETKIYRTYIWFFVYLHITHQASSGEAIFDWSSNSSSSSLHLPVTGVGFEMIGADLLLARSRGRVVSFVFITFSLGGEAALNQNRSVPRVKPDEGGSGG